MEQPPGDRQLAAWRELLTAHALVVEQIDRELAAAAVVPLTWYDVLVELHQALDGRLRMNELADAVLLSRSGLSRLVDRLERAGLLGREACPDDGRGAFAVITVAGENALREAWPVYARGIARHVGRHLSDDEATAIAGSLARISAAVRDPRQEP